MAAKKKKFNEKIRNAVCARCGGFEDATDTQIMAVWNLLDAETKKRYLAETKEKKEKGGADAGTGSK